MSQKVIKGLCAKMAHRPRNIGWKVSELLLSRSTGTGTVQRLARGKRSDSSAGQAAQGNSS